MPTDLPDRWRARAGDPVFWNDVTQLLKTVLAAVVAWLLATEVFSLSQSFLAPWAALLVVHATVYRTFSRGARQVAAAVVGVVLAWGVGHLLGLDTAAVVVVLAVGLAVGALPWFGDEATTVAATALIVLTTGFSNNDSMLLDRLADTAIGIATGLLVNLVVWPPLRRRTTITAMDRIDDRIGELLVDVAAGLDAGCDDDAVDAWIDRTEAIDGELDHAWSLVRQAQESARLNPRRPAREVRDPKDWRDLLRRMEQAVADTRSMARTLGLESARRDEWLPAFAVRWPRLLGDAGRAVAAADPVAVQDVRDQLNVLVADVGAIDPRPALWPVYGGLMINLRNILDAMHDVASANPLGQPPLPLAALRRRGARA